MPRIDPLQLLNCLNVLLTPSGGIKSEAEVARISSLMEKFSKKLVSKCVYLLILKSSNVQLLSKFMGLGGWNLIYNWLLHAVEAKNYTFLIELLEVIVICPVDIERLKSNPMPRQIKSLSKELTVHSKVRDLASDIVRLWLAIVKGTTLVASTSIVDSATTHTAINEMVVVVNNRIDDNDNRITTACASSEEEDAARGTYVKSPSPSSSSDDADVFISRKKSVGRPAKSILKEEKIPAKKVAVNDDPPKLKSKLMVSVNGKEPKRDMIKLKNEKKKEEINIKSKKERIFMEGRLKMKHKLKGDKEKEKTTQIREEKYEKNCLKEKKFDAKKDIAREEKLKDYLSKLIPKSLDKIGRIPKKVQKIVVNDHTSKDELIDEPSKPKNESSKLKSDSNKSKSDDKKVLKKDEKLSLFKPKESTESSRKNKEAKNIFQVPPKKPVSMSVEKRFATEEKPKTVKAYRAKFRLTGLEQEITLKPPTRKISSTGPTSHNSATTFSASLTTVSNEATVCKLPEKSAVKRSPTKDVENEPAEKKLRSPDISINEDRPSPVSAKTKKPFLQESDFFMNAMTRSVETQKECSRKRKKSASTTKAETEIKIEEGAPNKNANVIPPFTIKSEKDVQSAFEFYKETLNTSNEENAEVSDMKIAPAELKPSVDLENIKHELTSSPSKSTEGGLKSALSIFRGKRYPKKTVKWKRDDQLEAVQYFEVDVTERTNVIRNFWDMQIMERTRERESMLMVRKNAENDKMATQTKWMPLITIDIPPTSVVRGSNSQEKNIQYARELAVAPAIYFTRSMVPDTPTEPDLEIHSVTVPASIPLDDISGSHDSINDFSAFKWPEPKGYAPEGGEIGMITAANFMPNPAGLPPMFPPFPAPFQPFFPGAPVPPANWTPPNNGDQSQPNQNSIPWPMPPVGPPFAMAMGPPFPPLPPGPGFPATPNMFATPIMDQQQTVPNNDNGVGESASETHSYSSSNNYSCNSDSNGKRGGGNGSSSSRKWSSDDRYGGRKDGWKNNYSERNRDKHGSTSWRNRNRVPCRNIQNKGYCNVPSCRFDHSELN